ncbi:MAG TPA: ATP-binding protein [Bacteroidia bacterium]|nr:ATP-binding protein [Bacteroidia bacterium]
MLIRFKVSNYLSIKSESELSFIPGSIKEFEEENIIVNQNHNDLLKSVVLYGANSSGKSNFFKALEFVKKFILESSKDKQANEKINVQSFLLSSETEGKPSGFEIEFIIKDIKYKYGFEVDVEKVHTEYLCYTKKLKEYDYFRRKDNEIVVDNKFIGASGLNDKTRENALFLSVVAQWNGPIAIEIINWFSKLKFISDFNQPSDVNFTASLLDENSKYRKSIIKLLCAADLGFKEVNSRKITLDSEMLKDTPKEIRDILLNQDHYIISTIHEKYDATMNPVGSVNFNLSKNESLGTQKYFSMAGKIVYSLVQGEILIVDELDSRLHSLLSSFIIKLFNSKVNNKNKAQLICATHNTNILSKKILRRDQIILTQKNLFGATKLSTLLDSKNPRNDASFEKNYLEKDYEAVPFIEEDLDLFG